MGQLGQAVEAVSDNIRSGDRTLDKAWNARAVDACRGPESARRWAAASRHWRSPTCSVGVVETISATLYGTVSEFTKIRKALQKLADDRAPDDPLREAARVPAYAEALGDRMVQGFREYDSLAPAEIEQERSAQGAS